MTRTVEYTDHFEPTKYSEVVKEVFYNKDTQELYVCLHSGTIAGYTGVREAEYVGFSQSQSAGKYWNWYIKGNYSTTSGDVNFVPVSEPASKASTSTTTVLVHVEGDLKFDLDSTDILEAVKQVTQLVDKALVDGISFVKEVKVDDGN